MPSTFIEYPCQANNRADTTVLSWHPCMLQLAVGCANGAVNVFLEEVRPFKSQYQTFHRERNMKQRLKEMFHQFHWHGILIPKS